MGPVISVPIEITWIEDTCNIEWRAPWMYTDVLIICKACIKRHANARSDTQPRWLPKQSKTQPSCMVKDWSRGSTGIASCVVAGTYLQLGETDNNGSLFLCNIHYQHLYRVLNYPAPCAACSSLLKKGERRKCPDPLAISQYLRDTTGFDGSLTCDSELCNTCYKLHLHILKECPTLEHIASTFQHKLNMQ